MLLWRLQPWLKKPPDFYGKLNARLPNSNAANHTDTSYQGVMPVPYRVEAIQQADYAQNIANPGLIFMFQTRKWGTLFIAPIDRAKIPRPGQACHPVAIILQSCAQHAEPLCDHDRQTCAQSPAKNET